MSYMQEELREVQKLVSQINEQGLQDCQCPTWDFTTYLILAAWWLCR